LTVGVSESGEGRGAPEPKSQAGKRHTEKQPEEHEAAKQRTGKQPAAKSRKEKAAE
jgi:hypothetical protein